MVIIGHYSQHGASYIKWQVFATVPSMEVTIYWPELSSVRSMELAIY